MSDEQYNPDDEAIAAMVQDVIHVCEEKKAADIVLFKMNEESILADYYLVCCGLSMPHIRALASAIRRHLLDLGIRSRHVEGSPNSQWIILDYGVLLIHILTPAMRRYYSMEELWDKRLIVFQGGEKLPAPSEEDEEIPDFFEESEEETDDEDDEFLFADGNDDEDGKFADEDAEEDPFVFDDELMEDDSEEAFEEDEEEENDPMFQPDETPLDSPEDQEFRNKLFGGSSVKSPKNHPTLDDLFGKK